MLQFTLKQILVEASELWQYVYVIQTAAYSNPWDNVAFYDITFRELMASKPWRSWAKTYTQGWNMAFNNNHNYTHGSSEHGPCEIVKVLTMGLVLVLEEINLVTVGKMTVAGGLTRINVKGPVQNVDMTTDALNVLVGITVTITVEKGMVAIIMVEMEMEWKV